MRLKSHKSSAKYQSGGAPLVKIPQVKIGDRIYIKSDGSKNRARDQYVILRFVPNKNEVEVQKFLDKNRKNIVRVQLQNIYKVEEEDDTEDEKNDEPDEPVFEETEPAVPYKTDDHEQEPEENGSTKKHEANY